jgi:hypothetical protein
MSTKSSHVFTHVRKPQNPAQQYVRQPRPPIVVGFLHRSPVGWETGRIEDEAYGGRPHLAVAGSAIAGIDTKSAGTGIWRRAAGTIPKVTRLTIPTKRPNRTVDARGTLSRSQSAVRVVVAQAIAVTRRPIPPNITRTHIWSCACAMNACRRTAARNTHGCIGRECIP